LAFYLHDSSILEEITLFKIAKLHEYGVPNHSVGECNWLGVNNTAFFVIFVDPCEQGAGTVFTKKNVFSASCTITQCHTNPLEHPKSCITTP